MVSKISTIIIQQATHQTYQCDANSEHRICSSSSSSILFHHTLTITITLYTLIQRVQYGTCLVVEPSLPVIVIQLESSFLIKNLTCSIENTIQSREYITCIQ